jgi:hypothetical protein
VPVSATRYNGKLKKQIAEEAFKKFGPTASIQKVDAYFRKYGLPCCERSMYWASRRKAEGHVVPLRRKYRRNKEKKDLVGLIARTKQLAYDLGGYDQLEDLIKVLRDDIAT